MSHLGDRVSGLVDGELDGAERDKATAHLARCEQCRSEAASLRDLKRQLRALAEQAPAVADAEADLTRRLMEMTGHTTEQPAQGWLRVLPRGATSRQGLPRSVRQPRPLARRDGTPGGSRHPKVSRRQRRYLALGAVSIVVGLGTAAFTAGGGDPSAGPGPRVTVTPQLELYSMEHAITTGEVPFAGVPGSIEGGTGSIASPPAQKP
jgi:anti-sigma factor RsiW